MWVRWEVDSWGPRWLSYQPEEEICNTVNTIHKTFATVTFRGHLCGGGGVWSTTSNLHLELVDIKHGCFLFDIFYRFNRPFSSWSLIMGYGKCADLFTASQSKLQFIWGNTSQVHMGDSWECCFVPVLQMSQWSARMAGGVGGRRGGHVRNMWCCAHQATRKINTNVFCVSAWVPSLIITLFKQFVCDVWFQKN